MYRIIVLVGIAAAVVPVLGHLIVFGPKRLPRGKKPRTVRRFGLWERFIHLITVAGFLVLAGTGMIAVIGQRGRLEDWLWIIHAAAAPFFALGLSAIVVTWARDGVFAKYDWDWAKVFGGYLWGNKHAPAGRFNGGQKGYLWLAALLGLALVVSGLGRMAPVLDPFGQEILYFVHRAAAVLLIMMAIVHLYLGTFANPGTFGAMILGRVSPEWAEKHHPNWWDGLREDR